MKKLRSLLLCAALVLGLASPVRGADAAGWEDLPFTMTPLEEPQA